MKKIIFLFVCMMLVFSSVSFSYDRVFYAQSDEQWGFENKGRGYCWVCSYAMLISELTGENITPVDVAFVNQQKCENSAICYHYDIVDAFGVKFENALKNNEDLVESYDEYSGKTYLNCENDDDMILILKHALDSNPEGVIVRFESSYPHTMVASYYKDDVIYFNDPGLMNIGKCVEFKDTYNGQMGDSISDISFIQAIESKTNDVKVKINSDSVSFDYEPCVYKGRVMVPMRGIFEYLGADVVWDGETNSIYAQKDNIKMKLTIGDNTIMLGNKKVLLDSYPVLINGVTYVSVRAVSECFNLSVTWNDENKCVNIE